jgi:hypothetical protein
MESVFRKANLREKFLGWFKKSGIYKGRSASHKRPVLSPEKKKITEFNRQNSSLLATWAESFLFAGSSALLLLIANLLPYYWYFSLFALVPFLYRIIKATPTESLRVGIIFGICYFTVSVMASLPVSTIVSVLKILWGVSLFAAFGWLVGWVRKHWGFCPVMISILWLGIELGVMKFGVSGGLFERIETTNSLFHGLITLFGFLTVSATIVILNSLLVLAIVKTLEPTKAGERSSSKRVKRWAFVSTNNLLAQRVYLVADGRAPPFYGNIPKNADERVSIILGSH